MKPSREAPILVAEDAPEDIFYLTCMLKKCGIQNPIITVENGQQAKAMLETVVAAGEVKVLPCAIISDLRMPGMGGLDLLAWIRKQPALKRIPVLMFSELDIPNIRAQAEAAGATKFFAKFPPLDVFEASIREACGARI